MDAYYLGIDIGSTAVKAAVINRNGVAARGSRGYSTRRAAPECAEQSPRDWYDAAVSAVKGALECLPDGAAAHIRGISTSSQGGSIFAAGKCGEPLGDALSWMDRRAADEAAQINAALGGDFIRGRCGWATSAASCDSKLLWLKKHTCVSESASYFYTTQEYINLRLTGNAVTDTTGMAITRLYDYGRGCYIPEILELLGIGTDRLPRVLPCGAAAGKLLPDAAAELGLSAGIPVYVGAHDQYCASLGSGVTLPGQLLLATGTAWVIFGVAHSVPDGAVRPAACRHPAGDFYGFMSSLSGVGGALGHIASENGIKPAQLDRVILGTDGGDARRRQTSGLYICPLPSEPQLPHRDGVCGGITVPAGCDIYDTALAVMEGSAFEARALADAFYAAGFPRDGGIVMSGGAVSSALWSDIVAAVFGAHNLKLSGEADSPALGAAMIAAVSGGEFADYAEAATMLVSCRALPAKPELAGYYDRKYGEYRRLMLAD